MTKGRLEGKTAIVTGASSGISHILVCWTSPYELSRVRHELKNTREATIFTESMYYVAQSEEGRKALGSCGQQLTVGELKDVTETGCASYLPRHDCFGDHELFRVENGFFYPGSRTPNMCHESGRPSQTQSVGAKKLV